MQSESAPGNQKGRRDVRQADQEWVPERGANQGRVDQDEADQAQADGGQSQEDAAEVAGLRARRRVTRASARHAAFLQNIDSSGGSRSAGLGTSRGCLGCSRH